MNIISNYSIKALIAIALIFMNISCSEEEDRSAENIRNQISEYNEQINELTKKINELENELSKMGEVSKSQRLTPVTVSEIDYGRFERYVKLNGNVEAVNEAVISPEINGHIKSFNVKEGDRVEKGQIIARLNSEVIENNIKEVKTALELAETMYQRQKRLWEKEIGSEVQYLQSKNNYRSQVSRLETLESQLNMSVIRAPFSGIVEKVFQKQGELATPGNPMIHIIDLGKLYINIDVSERYLPAVSRDDKVTLGFPAYPDYNESVEIFRISNSINPENRTFRVQLIVDNIDEKIKPNMTAIVGLNVFSKDDAVTIPSFLIKQDIKGQFVYIVESDDDLKRVKKAYIKRGLDGEGKTMIESGLDKGDFLIIDGHNLVNEGALISVKN